MEQKEEITMATQPIILPQMEVRFSEQRDQLFTALAKARKTFKPVLRKSRNPFFKSKYADLAEILDATVESLSDNGLSVMQFPTMDMEGHVVIITVLGHASGQWAEGRLPMPIAKQTPQEVGSITTYGRRYSIGSLLNVASEDDDDGEAAMDRTGDKIEKAEEKFIEREGTARAGSALVDAAKAVFKNSGKTEKQLSDYLRAKFSADRPDQLTKEELQIMVQWLSNREPLEETLATSVTAATGRAQEAPISSKAPSTPPDLPKPNVGRLKVSEKQIGRLYAIAKSKGVPDVDIHRYIYEQYGYKSVKELDRTSYDETCAFLEKQ